MIWGYMLTCGQSGKGYSTTSKSLEDARTSMDNGDEE